MGKLEPCTRAKQLEEIMQKAIKLAVFTTKQKRIGGGRGAISDRLFGAMGTLKIVQFEFNRVIRVVGDNRANVISLLF